MNELRIHILQHVAFEGPAAIGDWALIHGHAVSSTHLFAKAAVLPATDDFDLLVIMGGPMGVDDVATIPWLGAEMEFVRKTVLAGKKLLGICLGAQILAHVLGGIVSTNPLKEIGWFPIQRSPELQGIWAEVFPAEYVAFHWHGQTFSLPQGAQAIGSSQACVNQGFLWNDQVLALQFHLETTPASAEALLAHGLADLGSEGVFVQSAKVIGDGAQIHCVRLNRLLDGVLQAFTAR
jgi:GMP synthase-like glutamine amidotransferase